MSYDDEQQAILIAIAGQLELRDELMDPVIDDIEVGYGYVAFYADGEPYRLILEWDGGDDA